MTVTTIRGEEAARAGLAITRSGKAVVAEGGTEMSLPMMKKGDTIPVAEIVNDTRRTKRVAAAAAKSEVAVAKGAETRRIKAARKQQQQQNFQSQIHRTNRNCIL